MHAIIKDFRIPNDSIQLISILSQGKTIGIKGESTDKSETQAIKDFFNTLKEGDIVKADLADKRDKKTSGTFVLDNLESGKPNLSEGDKFAFWIHLSRMQK